VTDATVLVFLDVVTFLSLSSLITGRTIRATKIVCRVNAPLCTGAHFLTNCAIDLEESAILGIYQNNNIISKGIGEEKGLLYFLEILLPVFLLSDELFIFFPSHLSFLSCKHYYYLLSVITSLKYI